MIACHNIEKIVSIVKKKYLHTESTLLATGFSLKNSPPHHYLKASRIPIGPTLFLLQHILSEEKLLLLGQTYYNPAT